MEVINTTAYHGTDKKYLNNIISKGFEIKNNDKHWLGNGVYFFIDYSLAEWWATNKHKDFGHNITEPTVIEVELTYKQDDIVDLKVLKDYNWIIEQYNDFHKKILEMGTKKIKIEKLRCVFFDWLKNEFDLKLIIVIPLYAGGLGP